ncbi:MAG: hypothetical protein ACI9XZ_003920 [Alphaproteobacteria bacterium]|jgi:hypothetical protein
MLSLTIRIAAVALCMATGSVTMSAASRAGDDSYYYEQSCAQLWHERNSIFASAGYCFKSQRAKSGFGTGCFPPFGKLHIGQKSTVKNIKRAERAKRC